jgi:ribosome-associated protein
MIEIKNGVYISEDKLVFKFSRSGGPGGQNVNKVSTKATVYFNVPACDTLTGDQKKRILARLTGRADQDGTIRVASQQHRTQQANRRAAIYRLANLLAGALKEKPVRKKTAVPYAAKQKRLKQKKRRSDLKHERTKREFDAESQ